MPETGRSGERNWRTEKADALDRLARRLRDCAEDIAVAGYSWGHIEKAHALTIEEDAQRGREGYGLR